MSGMNGWTHAKTIRVEDDVAKAIDEAEKGYSRFGDAWMGVTWLLARNGEKLSAAKKTTKDGVDYHLYKAEPTAEGMPEILVLYTIDDDQINIYGMKVYLEQESQKTARSTVTELHQGRKKN